MKRNGCRGANEHEIRTKLIIILGGYGQRVTEMVDNCHNLVKMAN